MKFLKVFVNSLISGLFFCSLLALLIYNLNVNLNFSAEFMLQMTLYLFITYGILITLFSTGIFFIFQFLSGKKYQISWISPTLLTINFSILVLISLAVFKINHDFFKAFFTNEILELIRFQTRALLVAAGLGVIISYGNALYQKKALFYPIYFTLLAALLFFSVKQRTLFPVPSKAENVAHLENKQIDKRVMIIGLEGLSFDLLFEFINDGKLPNFSLLMESGGWGKLANFSPSEPVILNNSFSTGKYPAKHRMLSTRRYQLLHLDQEIEAVPRYILFRQLTRIGLLLTRPESPLPRTKNIWKIFEENRTPFLKKDWPYAVKIKEPTPAIITLFDMFFKDLKHEQDEIFELVKSSFYTDAAYEEMLSSEKKESDPQLVYFLLNGLNIVSKYFYKYQFSDQFGNIEQEKITKYKSVIERYYQFYDNIVGKYLGALKENELLIVYSPHGIEPLPFWKRVVEFFIGNPDISAYHDLAPDGVIFFYGKEIERGKNLEGIKLIDIAPTLLYYLGFQVGLDMDGIVQTQLFHKDFRDRNPVPYIQSYDEISITSPQR